jgi:hypothetical protein
MVPILIGFIASVLGIGGIGEKIRSIIQKLQSPVNKALDFVIKTGLKLAGPVIRGLKGIGAKAKAKIAAGKAYVKGKVEAGKAYVKGKVEGVKAKLKGKPEDDRRTPEQKQAAVDSAIRDVEAAMAQPGAKKSVVAKGLVSIRKRYGLNELKLIDSSTPGQYHAHAALNPTKDSKDATGASDVTGMVAAYRGIHFKSTMDPETYKKAIARTLVGMPTFSTAALKLAGSKEADGSDVPDQDKEIAALYILDAVAKAKNPSAVRQWWGAKKQEFDSMYLALLQRYVNTYEGFAADAAAGKAGGFTAVPFISTTKKAAHAAAYAIGEKFIKDEEKRTTGVVGRAMVYLFSLKQLAEQDPANVQKLDDAGKIKVKARIISEGEVAFAGAIPGENLVAEHDAPAGIKAAELARRLETTAAEKAKAEGGLKSWD